MLNQFVPQVFLQGFANIDLRIEVPAPDLACQLLLNWWDFSSFLRIFSFSPFALFIGHIPNIDHSCNQDTSIASCSSSGLDHPYYCYYLQTNSTD